MPPPAYRVAIIGGGYAGMSAAVELCRAGVAPTVFEASGTLGGRARRVAIEGEVLDNGLHILIGAYRETLRMVEQVKEANDSPGLLRVPLELDIHHRFHLKAGALPAPLNMLQGLITASGLDAADKWVITRMMLSLRLRGYTIASDMSVADLLTKHGQTVRARKLLWEPLCVSALNTSPNEASSRVFAAVLRDTFASPASNCDLLLPTVDLTRLLPDRAANFVLCRGGSVRLACRVQAVRSTTSGVCITAGGAEESFDAAIIAVAPQHVSAIAQQEPALTDAVQIIDRFSYRPIHSIYLGYGTGVQMPRPMQGLDARYAQWVFDRGQLCGQHGTLGVVISADGQHQDLPQSTLAAAVHAELADAFPGLPPPRWHRVIAEKRATIASTVGLHRPTVRTGSPRLFLAGDYVETVYPATLEAAVRSGVHAARLAASPATQITPALALHST